MHMWSADLSSYNGGIEDVFTTRMHEKQHGKTCVQDMGERGMKTAICGKCQEKVRLSQLAIYDMSENNRCWHCWNRKNPATHTLGDFK